MDSEDNIPRSALNAHTRKWKSSMTVWCLSSHDRIGKTKGAEYEDRKNIVTSWFLDWAAIIFYISKHSMNNQKLHLIKYIEQLT